MRRQLYPLSKARAIQALADLERRRHGDPGIEFRERLAQQLGGNISGRTVDRYLKLLTLPRPIQDAVSRNELAMTKALKVASLPETMQKAMATAIVAGETPNAVVRDRLPRPTTNVAKEEDSPADLYFVFVDFLTQELDSISEHAGEIVGKATAHEVAAALLEQAARFCERMRDLELAALRDGSSRHRSRIEIN